jgi:hypothetical protein
MAAVDLTEELTGIGIEGRAGRPAGYFAARGRSDRAIP